MYFAATSLVLEAVTKARESNEKWDRLFMYTCVIVPYKFQNYLSNLKEMPASFLSAW